jgi:hypothetical protein
MDIQRPLEGSPVMRKFFTPLVVLALVQSAAFAAPGDKQAPPADSADATMKLWKEFNEKAEIYDTRDEAFRRKFLVVSSAKSSESPERNSVLRQNADLLAVESINNKARWIICTIQYKSNFLTAMKELTMTKEANPSAALELGETEQNLRGINKDAIESLDEDFATVMMFCSTNANNAKKSSERDKALSGLAEAALHVNLAARAIVESDKPTR